MYHVLGNSDMFTQRSHNLGSPTTRERAGPSPTSYPTWLTSWCAQPPFLEPTKIILVVSEANLAQAESLFRGKRLIIFMGIRYLGSYSRDAFPQVQWLGEKVQD